MKIESLNHVGLTVSDLKQAVAFFRDALGFRLQSSGSRDRKLVERLISVQCESVEIAYLTKGDFTVELLQFSGCNAPDQLLQTGATHFAFNVSDLEALTRFASRMNMRPI